MSTKDEKPRKDAPDFTLENKKVADDDEEPRVIKCGSIKDGDSNKGFSRRDFMRGSIATGGGAIAATTLTGCSDKGPKSDKTATKSNTCELRYYLSHSSTINWVAFSADGKKIASGGEDWWVKVWDAATGALLLTYKGHAGAVNSVAFSPDGKKIASASDDNTVHVWDTTSGALLYRYTGHGSYDVIAVAFSPDGKKVASGGADGNIFIWDSTTGSQFLKYTGHGIFSIDALAFSPDGKKIASSSYAGTPSPYAVHIWDSSTGTLFFKYSGHSTKVSVVVFNTDGTRVASAAVAYASTDTNVHMWDSGTGAVIQRYVGGASAAFSPDGTKLATGGYSYDYTVKVYPTTSSNIIRTYAGHSNSVLTISINADNKVASAGKDMRIHIWDINAGTVIGILMDTSLTQVVVNTTSCTSGGTVGCTCNTVCTCDQVCTCDLVCTCDTVCTCDSQGGGGYGGHYWYPC